jgi:hypothetical protein
MCGWSESTNDPEISINTLRLHDVSHKLVIYILALFRCLNLLGCKFLYGSPVFDVRLFKEVGENVGELEGVSSCGNHIVGV